MSKESEQQFFDHTYDSDARQAVGQVYSLTRNRMRFYRDVIARDVRGLRVLEYGCGEGSHAFFLAEQGADVVGIDISEVGIRKARAEAADRGLTGAEFVQMDAEAMDFPDASFDLVIGEGILHHLDLDKAVDELRRVIRPGGRAVFMEPLGHNPAINVFRTLTPRLRTPDEHPLVRRELRQLEHAFGRTDYRYFHLTSFAAMALLRTRIFFPAVDVCDRIDRALFRVIPPLGLLAWYVVMIFSEPAAESARRAG